VNEQKMIVMDLLNKNRNQKLRSWPGKYKVIFSFSLLSVPLRKVFIFGFSLFFLSTLTAQDLQSLIEEALANNPEIQKYELQYNIASEKVHEVNSLPNAEFGFGYFLSEPETRTGAQRFKLSTKQMMPWFGTITTRENYMSSLADAEYENIAIAKRQIASSVAQTYYKMFAFQATQKVLVENIKLLRTYETLALTSVEVGNASVVDVLKLQIRQNELEQSNEVLGQLLSTEQTTLNKLLNRDKSVGIKVTQELIIPLETPSVDSETLELHPELTQYDKLFQSVEQSELLNQKEANPMVGIGFDYIAVAERPNMNFNDNGKDIVMPMLSLSIPIFNGKFKSQTKQNALKQQEISSRKQERLNSLETALNKAINNRIAAQIRNNTQAKNLEQAKYAEEILIKSFETGSIDFNEVLDIQNMQLKFQIDQIESIKDYYLQTTIINYLSSQ
jgi:outer membrane protein TolC